VDKGARMAISGANDADSDGEEEENMADDDGTETQKVEQSAGGAARVSDDGEAESDEDKHMRQEDDGEGEGQGGSEGVGLGSGELPLPGLPYSEQTEYGSYTLEALGAVLFDQEGYHDSECIYPVGFRGRHELKTASGETVNFLFEMRYDGRESGGPAFAVRAECEGGAASACDSSCVMVDPDTAWDGALRRASKVWPWQEDACPDGRALLGLSSPAVRRMIEAMPGSCQCAKYQKQVPPGKGGAPAGLRQRLGLEGAGEAEAEEAARRQRQRLRNARKFAAHEDRKRDRQAPSPLTPQP